MALIRHFLRNDVLAAIKANIAQGVWKDSLPSERQLTEQFQVSRGTLRYALKNLQNEGIIKAVAGSGYLITKQIPEARKPPTDISIGILIGSPLKNRSTRDLAWLPALQQRVAKRGWHIHIHEGIPEVQRSPKSGLNKLFKATSHECWLLIRCNEEVQKIFRQTQTPAIICGSPFADIDLPSIDINFEAIGRHAAGLLASKGHQRIGYVSGRNPFPGDEKLYKGFQEGILKSSTKPSVKRIRYSGPQYSYQNTLKQVQQKENPITAMFVDCPFQYINLSNQANQAGIHIPEDLSLVCRQEADFLSFLNPIPSRYEFHTKEMANKIHRDIEARIQGDTMHGHRNLIMPEYFEGSSITSLSP